MTVLFTGSVLMWKTIGHYKAALQVCHTKFLSPSGGEDKSEGAERTCVRDPHPNPLPGRERGVNLGAALQRSVVTTIGILGGVLLLWGWCGWCQEIGVGMDERIRHVYFSNIVDLDQEADDLNHFYRFRTRVWANVALGSDVELYLRLTNEHRRYLEPDIQFEWDEVIVDNAYADWNRPAGLPFSLRLGRQDVVVGKGFVLLEGGPLDGSRSIYQNGVRVRAPLRSATFEVIGAVNPSQDEYLPLINDRHRQLIENDQLVWGFFMTEAAPPKGVRESYYVYLEESAPETGDLHTHFSTLGLRVSGETETGFIHSEELAMQWGRCNGQSHRAYGGYILLERPIRLPLSPSVKAGYVHLSGDNPITTRDEGWHPVLGRWPQWSELLIYTVASEGGVAYWTNLGMFRAGLSFSPRTAVTTSLSGSLLFAHYAGPGRNRLIGGGRVRGQLVQAETTVQFNPHLSGHALVEYFNPGDFYREQADDAIFARWELEIKI
jgi:hypothetical protein